MSRLDSDEVTFHDVAALFSKEEWTLLHEWQKELYRNVMKEIHQALISLGPLIATTVFSLRAKEKQELYPMDNTDSERRHNINNYSSDTITNPDVLFGINREEHLRLNIPQDAEGRERIDCLSTGFPFSNTSFRSTDICLRKEEPSVIFIDHLGTEVGESCTNPSLADPVVTAVFSLSTNNEEETHFKEEPVGRTTADPVVTSVFTLRLNNVEETNFMEESVGRSARNGAMSRKQKEEHFVKSPERSTPCIASLGNTQTLVLQNSERQTQSRSQLWAGSNQEPEGEATSFSNPAHSSLQKGIVKLGGSGKDNECESNPKNTKLLTSQKNTKHYWGHTCNEYGTNFNEKGMFVRHQRTHTGKRRYQCTECEKSFSQKADVVRHQRTHTGEKPYHCSECEKSFSQKADLCRHQRTHTGDRPYKCTVCEKSFSQKGNLIAHKRTHTGERPYKCTVCMKNFSRKLSLTVHQRTHIITQFRDTSPERDLQLI